MKQLLSRMAWRNLSVRARSLALLIAQLMLVVGLAGLALSHQAELQRQVRASVTGENTLAEALGRLDDAARDLEEINIRVSEGYAEPGFDLVATVLFLEHRVTLAEARDAIQDMRVIVAAGQVDSTRRASVEAELTLLETNLTGLEEGFAPVEDIIRGLILPDAGALNRLAAASAAFHAAALQIPGDTDLLNDAYTVRDAEAAILANTGGQTLSTFMDALTAYERRFDLIGTSVPDVDMAALSAEYAQAAEQASTLLTELKKSQRIADLRLADISGSVERLATLTGAFNQGRADRLEQVLRAQRQMLLAVVAAVLILTLVLIVGFGESISRGLRPLLGAASDLEAGKLTVRVPVQGEDEFNRLALSFNAMALQLESLVGGLEQRVAEATRDLAITAEIGQSVVRMGDPRDLMDSIIELIRRRFGFYHAQVFLVDEAAGSANLVASTGIAGRELLARKHTLPVGSQSVIGQVTAAGRPLIALDTESSPVHRRNELLPDTRSEMALPMRVGDRVIGALDIQSVAANAFDDDDIAVFQIIADQLAIAIDNARLYTRLADAESRLYQLEHAPSTDAWSVFHQSRQGEAAAGYQVVGERIEPVRGEASPALQKAILSGRIASFTNGEDDIHLAVPITVRGEVIGAFGFGGEHIADLTEEDLSLVQAVIDRVGLALENLRLVEQTSRRAEHEQVVNEITAKIVGSTDVNYILQTTVRELGRVLGAPQTVVQLRREGG
ncbi:MAG: GAF domain-containing protein [Anaerolineae bacterium]|nr:GAF domain-containing protein [Anaerolineae bacterium]